MQGSVPCNPHTLTLPISFRGGKGSRPVTLVNVCLLGEAGVAHSALVRSHESCFLFSRLGSLSPHSFEICISPDQHHHQSLPCLRFSAFCLRISLFHLSDYSGTIATIWTTKNKEEVEAEKSHTYLGFKVGSRCPLQSR